MPVRKEYAREVKGQVVRFVLKEIESPGACQRVRS